MTPAIPEGYGLDTPLRRAHFLAQLAHESGGFTRLVENLNYSADGLRRTWPARFDAAAAAEYARKPERIANKVYADRLGNGDEASGDGWRFRGRGPLMLTGRANYAEYSQLVFGDDRLSKNPELAACLESGMKIAAAYWRKSRLNELADRDDLQEITRRINGGLIGLSGRAKWLDHFKQSLMD